MGPIVLGPLLYFQVNWPKECGYTKSDKSEMVMMAFSAWGIFTFVVSFIFFLYLNLRMLPTNWSYDRLFAFLIGQMAFALIIAVVFYFIDYKEEEKQKED